MKTKKTLSIIAITILVVLSITLVLGDSYELTCLTAGETLPLDTLCNPAMSPRTGPLNICMHLLDNGKECPALINKCNALGLSCTSSNSTTVDRTPPTITISSPIESGIYNGRQVLLNISTNEESGLYFLDNLNGRNKWTRICSGCSSYLRRRSFDEGFNNITIRANDVNGNFAYKTVTFTLDSQKPRITKTEPSRRFASGIFKKFLGLLLWVRIIS